MTFNKKNYTQRKMETMTKDEQAKWEIECLKYTKLKEPVNGTDSQ